MDLAAETATATALAREESAALAGLPAARHGTLPKAVIPFSRSARTTLGSSRGAPAGEPGWWGIAAIAQAYRSGQATPVSLVETLLARIARVDPRLNSFVHLDAEAALARARDPDLPMGPLHGVPVAIKDVIDVAGMPTTCHSRLRLGAVAARDAAIVALLREAGAIVLGKLATHEFAIGGPSFDLPFPPARNPWDLRCHPGGSSSGAGAAVAAGLVPLAVGTDTAGSVRNPASACGIVGLKPTQGLLSLEGVVPLAWSLDHVGLLTRSVEDLRLALGALGALGAPPRQAHRIGYVRHFHSHDVPAEPEIAEALDRAAAALGAVEVTLPPLGEFALVNRVILQSEGYAYHADDLRRRPEAFARRTRDALLPGGSLAAADYLAARRAQAALTEAVEAQFALCDVLLCASSMTLPCRIDDDAAIDRTYMRQARTVFNLTGHPALAMRAGQSASGLPLSLQLAARRGEEATLLAVAEVWERALGPPPRPSMA